MKTLYFSGSNNLIQQITDLYDFVWPTASAIWNLRWQVKGFVNEIGLKNINDQNLLNRFDWGSGIHGVNIKRFYLEKTWDEQQEEFAKFLLINLCSIFESWIDYINNRLCIPKGIIEQLQFPTIVDSKGKVRGVNNAINEITQNKSILIQNAFYPILIKHKKNSKSNLENLLFCYRYFKECRNSFAHRGGLANQKTYDAYLSFLPVAKKSLLGVSEIPIFHPIKIDHPIKISLRGIVGFGEIIIKIVTTLDAELACSLKSEKEIIERFNRWAKEKGKGEISLKKDLLKRSNQIKRITRNLGFPEPIKTEEIENLLIHERILTINF